MARDSGSKLKQSGPARHGCPLAIWTPMLVLLELSNQYINIQILKLKKRKWLDTWTKKDMKLKITIDTRTSQMNNKKKK